MTQVKTKLSDFTDAEIKLALTNAPATAKLHIKALNDELELRKQRGLAENDFMQFVKEMWPTFIHGKHHEKMARAFDSNQNKHDLAIFIFLESFSF